MLHLMKWGVSDINAQNLLRTTANITSFLLLPFIKKDLKDENECARGIQN